MPLIFTGITVERSDLNGLSIQAKDSATGKTVVVVASYEAIQDYGQDRAQDVASDKYDKGKTEPDGSVLVYTAECA